MSDKFYEDGPSYKKIKEGKPTDMIFAIDLNKSHLFWGPLLQVGSQLFAQYLPQIGAGSYLQVRQDQVDKNTVDIEIFIPGSKRKLHKPPEIHHQAANNTDFYYTAFAIDGQEIRIGIGSGITNEDFFSKLLMKHMSDWNSL